MSNLLKAVVVLAMLAIVGWLRMPYEQALSENLQQEHLLTPSFDTESRASLSQKGFIASFGCLRPTLAAVAALSTVKHHGQSDWEGLEEAVETTVLLDPYNPYYWDLGGWHLAYNASSSFRENTEFPPLKREKLFRQYIEKGDAFYRRGISLNPHDYSLRMALTRLWSSNHHIEDYAKVAQLLEDMLDEVELDLQQSRRARGDLFFALLRIPNRAQQAYELGRVLYEEDIRNRFPSLINGLCALQMHPRVEARDPLSLPQLYGDRKRADKWISNYLKDEDRYKPRYGMVDLLRRLRAVNE